MRRIVLMALVLFSLSLIPGMVDADGAGILPPKDPIGESIPGGDTIIVDGSNVTSVDEYTTTYGISMGDMILILLTI